MKKLLIAAALAIAPAAATAQDAPASAQSEAAAPALPDADPPLWVVRDDDTTVYLFGTIHLLDARPWFNDEVKTAFDASDELVVEAIIPENPAELQPLLLRYAVDPQGRKLSERLTPEQNAELGRILGSIGAPAAAFDNFEPWFVSMTLATVVAQQLGLDAANGPEGVLVRAARAANRPVVELEGIEWQLRLFDGMPEAQQLAQLQETLEEFETARDTFAPMLAAWSAGDAEAFRHVLFDREDRDLALHRLVFTQRNAAWAAWINQRLARPGTVFLAVGAGHLAGGDGVPALLAAYGLTAERVAQ